MHLYSRGGKTILEAGLKTFPNHLQMTTYKSKIGLVPVLAVGILLGAAALLFILTGSLLGFGINLLLGAMVAFVFTSIRYINPRIEVKPPYAQSR
jgi:hypothetical protein